MNATCVSTTFAVSFFRNSKDVSPSMKILSLDELIQRLTAFSHAPRIRDKADLPAWSPARFRPSTTRKAVNVVDISCLVLDLDTPPFDPEPWQRWCYVRHSTWSHTPAHPKSRLVLPLARPVAAAEWPSAWGWARSLAPELDKKCSDASRLYFLPALADPAQPHEAEIHDGALLDLAAVCAALPPAPPPAPVIRLPAPWFLRRSVAARRLCHDPLTREDFAQRIGASLQGEGRSRRAAHIPCPACRRPSVWFPIHPERLRWASCNHRNSCGWRGPLDALPGAA